MITVLLTIVLLMFFMFIEIVRWLNKQVEINNHNMRIMEARSRDQDDDE